MSTDSDPNRRASEQNSDYESKTPDSPDYKPEPPRPDDGRKTKDPMRLLLSRFVKRVHRASVRHRRPVEPYTPWLVIRDSPGDMGERPIAMSAMNWTSPDIWVESSSPMGNAVLGQENFIHARIFNFGSAPAYPVRVDFFLAFGMMGIVPEALSHVGTQWVSVDSQRSVDVRCETPFIAALPPVEGVIEAFYTFVVNCTCPGDDPITERFQPWLDRHVGTRNVLVMEAGGGGGDGGGIVLPPPVLTNPTPMSGRGEVLMRLRSVSVDPRAGREGSQIALVNRIAAASSTNQAKNAATHGMSGAPSANARAQPVSRAPDPAIATRRRGSQPLVRAKLSDDEARVLPKNRWRSAARLMQAAAGLPNVSLSFPADYQVLEEADFRPFESKRLHLDLRLPTDAQPGDWFALDLGLQIEQMAVGGYTILIKVS